MAWFRAGSGGSKPLVPDSDGDGAVDAAGGFTGAPGCVAGSLMSLGALDFGLLGDSAVIQVENVLARGTPTPDARLAAVRAAVLEVRAPTLYGELCIAAVFLPVLTLEGVEGDLFRPMALTMLFALGTSLALSLTLVPVLATFIVPTVRPATAPRVHLGARVSRTWTRVVAAYRAALRLALRAPLVVVALALAAVAGGAWLATGLGAEFVPRLDEGSIVINTIRLAGVSIDESVRYADRIERFLLAR